MSGVRDDTEARASLNDLTQPRWQTYQEIACDPGQSVAALQSALGMAAIDLMNAAVLLHERDEAREALWTLAQMHAIHSNVEANKIAREALGLDPNIFPRRPTAVPASEEPR